MRLVNGSTAYNGRVEIFANNQWGTVCDNNWGITDASIVCKQLGFPAAVGAPGGAPFGEGKGTILLNNVACDGSEASLFQCPHNGSNVQNVCQHSKDAGAVCGVKG